MLINKSVEKKIKVTAQNSTQMQSPCFLRKTRHQFLQDFVEDTISKDNFEIIYLLDFVPGHSRCGESVSGMFCRCPGKNPQNVF